MKTKNKRYMNHTIKCFIIFFSLRVSLMTSYVQLKMHNLRIKIRWLCLNFNIMRVSHFSFISNSRQYSLKHFVYLLCIVDKKCLIMTIEFFDKAVKTLMSN